MILSELLATLDQRGIELWFEGNQLRFRAPKGALSEELRTELSQNKNAVLDVLRQKACESEVTHPLSHNQQALWFLKEAYPESPAYNVAFSAQFCSEVNLPGLRNACQALVDRHPMLRTTYVADQGIPIQRIHGYQDVCFEVIDASSWDDEKLREQVIHAYRMPFDLEHGPLFRVSLFTRSSTDHVFLLAAHHIAIDGWSTWLIIDELHTLYSALSKGMTIPLHRPKNHYLDYVNWQANLLNGETGEQLWDFWRQQLDGKLSTLDLPSDRPRSSMRIGYGASYTFSLSEELAQGIKALAKAESATLYMLLLAAFQTLLYRYTGQENILVGSPMSGRSRPEFAGLVGCFVNSVVLSADFTENAPFRKLLNRTRQIVLDALNNQDFPLRLLTQRLRSKQGTAGSPIFQVDFVLQKPQQFGELSSLFSFSESADTRIDFGGIEIKQFYLPQQEGQLDLTLEMMEGDNSLFGILKYNTDLFDVSTIHRLVSHFQNLLKGIISDPDQLINQIPILGEAERQQLLDPWNNERMDSPQPNQCIHQLFETQVTSTPDEIAVVIPATELNSQRQTLTYRELNQLANQLAHYLINLGMGPESIVGICVNRSLEMIVGVLGVLKAGGAYLPLDPLYPQERLNYSLTDSGTSILLTQQTLADIFEGTGLQVINLDADWPVIAGESNVNPPCRVTPSNLVYTTYTSGSTGQSKGVMVEHRNLVNAYLAWEEAYQLKSLTSHLQMANFPFDVFSGDLVRALCSGGKLVICPRELLLAPQQLYKLMLEEKIDCAEFVPAVLRQLVKHLQETQKTLDFVKLLICGSDSWYVAEYEDFLSVCGEKTRLINSFGLTEATIDSTYFEGPVHEMPRDRLVPIGKPFANTQLYILDQYLQPMPIGVAGELYVGGQGVARGYLNRPELNSQKFIRDPFNSQQGGRLYKTGDKARYLPDGNIEFLGRMDNQVKIRGFRVELGEIEAVLGKHPGVSEAVVVAHQNHSTEKQLVAYIVPNEAPPSPQELRGFLQKQLPDYMIPNYFVALDSFPLSASGKINRKVLPEPDANASAIHKYFSPPQTPLQELVAGVWADILGLNQVGIEDNFFELGGHSLLATQVMSRLQRLSPAELPLRILFEFPTVASLTTRIESLQGNKTSSALPITAYKRQGPMPLSYSQERVWFLDQLEPGNLAYNMPAAIRLKGPLNLACLEQTLNEILARHEVLRTNFDVLDDQPVQIISPIKPLPLTFIDLSDLPLEEQSTEAKRFIDKESKVPFDLRNDLLMRASLLKLNAEEHIFLLNQHHIVTDGWSITIFWQEFATLYNAFTEGQASPLRPLPIQYADFAQWQHQWLKGEVLETQLAYWKKQLTSPLPVLNLPTDYPRPKIQTFNGARHSLALSEDVTKEIKKLSREEGATLFMVLLAAFNVLLYRYTGQSDVVIGSPIAGRNRAELESLIGFFLNTLVLRNNLEGNPSFREMIKRVRDVSLKAYANQDIPFEKLLEELHPERDLSRTPIFQIFFNMLNLNEISANIPGLSGELISSSEIEAKFDLTLYVKEENKRIQLNLVYNTSLFSHERMAEMARQLEKLLEQIAESPDKSIDLYSLFTNQARSILPDPTITLDEPEQTLLPQLISKWAKESPYAIAIEKDTQGWTYEELDEQAALLARQLIRNGLKPGDVVAVYGSRSFNLIVSMLSVFVSGGVLLSIDDNLPDQRKQLMLHEASAKALIYIGDKRLEEIPWAGKLAPENILIFATSSSHLSIDKTTTDTTSDSLPQLAGDDPAYIFFTSGTTGRPKGVQGTHKGLSHFLIWQRDTFGIEPGDRAAQLTALSFDVVLRDIFVALVSGATLCLPDDNIQLDANKTLEWLQTTNISIVHTVPTLAQTWLSSTFDNLSLTNLRWIFFAGEPLKDRLVDEWRKNVPQSEIVNLYGPTETTMAKCFYQVPDQPLPGIQPVGRALPQTQALVINRNGQLCGIGEPGEIVIRTPFRTRGYINDPAENLRKFIGNPFREDEQDKVYFTGDQGRFRPDGQLEILGRIDSQVKIRGNRIELSEIESALAQHPAVKQTVVSVWETEAGDKRLAAYIVTDSPQPLQTSELRSFLKAQLPDYMIPASFMTLDAIPLTPNGKINRQALPIPNLDALPQKSFVPPQTDTEKAVAQIWAEVLKLQRVGIHDNFFELGGHSLLATQVASRIRRAFQIDLPLRDLFTAPTVAQSAELIETITWATQGQTTSAKISIDEEEELEL